MNLNVIVKTKRGRLLIALRQLFTFEWLASADGFKFKAHNTAAAGHKPAVSHIFRRRMAASATHSHGLCHEKPRTTSNKSHSNQRRYRDGHLLRLHRDRDAHRQESFPHPPVHHDHFDKAGPKSSSPKVGQIITDSRTPASSRAIPGLRRKSKTPRRASSISRK